MKHGVHVQWYLFERLTQLTDGSYLVDSFECGYIHGECPTAKSSNAIGVLPLTANTNLLNCFKILL